MFEFSRMFEGIESRFEPESFGDTVKKEKPVYSAETLAKYDAILGDDEEE